MLFFYVPFKLFLTFSPISPLGTVSTNECYNESISKYLLFWGRKAVEGCQEKSLSSILSLPPPHLKGKNNVLNR